MATGSKSSRMTGRGAGLLDLGDELNRPRAGQGGAEVSDRGGLGGLVLQLLERHAATARRLRGVWWRRFRRESSQARWLSQKAYDARGSAWVGLSFREPWNAGSIHHFNRNAGRPHDTEREVGRHAGFLRE